ncbi:hypothetical protein O988_02086 [Pseudogymnoascus sp. VKM F-3808]|nr:hypothetical protein O988_02086 [Pseudogymnoascus sp. VKM F-3808]
MRVNAAALESNRLVRAEWQRKLATYDHDKGLGSELEGFVSEFHSGKPCRVVERFEGAFNYCFRLRFDMSDHDDWLLRFPIPGDVMYPTEKVDQEVAVMKFIKEKTRIPIPKVIASGRTEGRFAGLGPFIIMEFVEGERLDEALYQNGNIKPEIGQSTLDFIYKQMAQIYLELFEHDFDQIGGLSMSLNGQSWHVKSGPLTLKTNEDNREPSSTTAAYLDKLVDQHTRLLCENPESVSDDVECQEEYRCLQTIKMLTQQLASSVDCNGPFKLFLDDLRFGNILVDSKTFEIKALIDWEFCYAAPRQFLNAPPPWFIPNPDPWDWTAEERDEYKLHFTNFMTVLQDEESVLGKDHSFSARMQTFLENGTFWHLQALREPLCCLELMESWSAEVGKPLETPVDMEEFVARRFEPPTLE